MQRRATIAAALTLGCLSAPAELLAQTRGPDANTPRLLVAVFASADKVSGVQASDAVRTRIQSAVAVRQLYVIPKTDITNYLESSGYKSDSALGTADLKELAKLLRADEVLAGIVTRMPSGIRVEPRLLLARDPRLAQPLPTVDAANPGDAARPIERALAEARKQLLDNRACENHIRANAFDKAILAANAGIAKYPNATLVRLCLATAYQTMKAPPDSVLRVVAEIRKLDPKNSIALGLAFGAYQAKGDQENAIRALVGMLALEPHNSSLQDQVVTELAKLGKPSIAIPIVDSLMAQNPGDPKYIRQKWLLTLAAAAADTVPASRLPLIESAVKAGEDMVRADTMLADSTYFARQIAAASAGAQTQKAVEFASLAVRRFPNSAEFWMLKANAERKAGQLQMAQQSVNRVLSINPKYANGNLLLAQIHVEMNQPDSAVAIARRAVVAGEDPKIWGAFLLGPTQVLVKQAQTTDSVLYWERASALAQEGDRLSPSSTSKFLVGVTSFQVGFDALRRADAEQRLKKPDKAKICTLSRTAQDMFVLTQTTMPAGGSVDPKVAGQVLGLVNQYGASLDQMIKTNCKK